MSIISTIWNNVKEIWSDPDARFIIVVNQLSLGIFGGVCFVMALTGWRRDDDISVREWLLSVGLNALLVIMGMGPILLLMCVAGK